MKNKQTTKVFVSKSDRQDLINKRSVLLEKFDVLSDEMGYLFVKDSSLVYVLDGSDADKNLKDAVKTGDAFVMPDKHQYDGKFFNEYRVSDNFSPTK